LFVTIQFVEIFVRIFFDRNTLIPFANDKNRREADRCATIADARRPFSDKSGRLGRA